MTEVRREVVLLLLDGHRSVGLPDLNSLVRAVGLRHVEDDSLLVGVDIELALVLVDLVALHVIHGDDPRQTSSSRGLERLLGARTRFSAIEPVRGYDGRDESDQDGSDTAPHEHVAVVLVPTTVGHENENARHDGHYAGDDASPCSNHNYYLLSPHPGARPNTCCLRSPDGGDTR